MSIKKLRSLEWQEEVDNRLDVHDKSFREHLASLQEMYDNCVNLVTSFNAINDKVERMRIAMNNQAEKLGLLTYTIEKYLPRPHLEEAAAEYKALREKERDQELEAAKASAPRTFVN